MQRLFGSTAVRGNTKSIDTAGGRRAGGYPKQVCKKCLRGLTKPLDSQQRLGGDLACNTETWLAIGFLLHAYNDEATRSIVSLARTVADLNSRRAIVGSKRSLAPKFMRKSKNSARPKRSFFTISVPVIPASITIPAFQVVCPTVSKPYKSEVQKMKLRQEVCGREDCSNHGECVGVKKAPICFCETGYYGTRCENAPRDLCKQAKSLAKSFKIRILNLPDHLLPKSSISEPCDSRTGCNNHGLCLGSKSKFSCLCNPGYRGPYCGKTSLKPIKKPKIPLFDNACTPEDCRNRGVCVGSKDQPTCLCYLGFSGAKCENAIIETLDAQKGTFNPWTLCSSSDCNNNGVCLGTKNKFVCMCNLGFSGKQCEETWYPLCDPSDCNNHGLCVGNKKTFVCACHLGYTGRHCEKVVGTLCDSSDCNNNGMCVGIKGSETCVCSLGYYGARCEKLLGGGGGILPITPTDICTLGDCNHNGLCIGTRTLPICLCNLGFLGLRCEIEPPCNSLLQCSGNGLCIGSMKHFSCSCNVGWSGANCQNFIGK
ncbi:unnamed protein product [Bursaphelenchus xylophilus]|uniref:(pine wood nematode) hypothetical protein n=1 Tax=Bursaphelenchus xylophilus TaxID=6326 RepID=A0A811LC69_BURXY|nr:unnamed protein product [Bursaphelenchus xylophilus]CAG9114187.1 unnamed protein product [Bursaphelenchus xylophilus]